MFSKLKLKLNKKGFIFSLFLIVAIAMSAIVSFPFKTNVKVEELKTEVNAPVELKTKTEGILLLNYVEPKGNIVKTSNGSWNGSNNNVSGGTTITVSGWYAGATITWVNGSDTQTHTYTPTAGYRLKQFNVYAASSASGDVKRTIEFNTSTTSDTFTPENIISSGYNPNGNKTIFIEAVTEVIPYDLNLYYSVNDSNTYTAKKVDFNVETAVDLTSAGETDDGIVDWKYWIVRKSAVAATYNGYNLTISDDKKLLTITKNTNSDSDYDDYGDVQIKFTLNAETDTGYEITNLNIGSYGDFDQDPDNPLLAARITRTFNLTITSGDSTSGWNGSSLVSGTVKEGLVGAYSTDEEDDITAADSSNYFTKILIKDNADYQYGFMDSEYGTTGLSFHHKDDFDNTTNLQEYATAGKYYVYNYGYKITGYQIYYTYGGTIYYASLNGGAWSFSESGDGIILISDLSGKNLSQVSEELDEIFAGKNVKSKDIAPRIVPQWETVEIQLDTNDSNATKVTYNSTYGLGALQNNGKSLINYVTKKGKTFVLGGRYNYCGLDYGNYSYNGDGKYTLALNGEGSAVYVDNMYKVAITNIESGDVRQDPYGEGTSTHAKDEYTYENYSEEGKYEFTNYSSGLIENYISGTFEGLKTRYIAGINDSNANKFVVLNKVYGSVEAGLYIYLTNDHNYTMPVYTRPYHDLLFYENNVGNCLYKTDKFDIEDKDGNLAIHNAEKPSGKDFQKDGEGNYKWYLADGGSVGSLQINAHWFRKNYKLDINTFLYYETNNETTKSFNGYVRIEITDTVYPSGTKCKSGNYFVRYYNGGMKIYSVNNVTIAEGAKGLDLDTFVEKQGSTEAEVYINLYAGCDIVVTEVDQSGDVDAVMRDDDSFLDMVGFKHKETTYDGPGDNDVGCKAAFETKFKDVAEDKEINADEIEALGYISGSTIEIKVIFTEIKYNFKVELDNDKAGNIVIHDGTTQTIDLHEYNLVNLDVLQNKNFGIEYEAVAGYGYKYKEYTLGAYDYDNVELNYLGVDQTYWLKFDSRWLRDYYYKTFFINTFPTNDVTLDENSNIIYENSNTIYVNTDTFDFKFGVKIYDSTSNASNGVIETKPTAFETSFKLDAKTGKATTAKTVGDLLTEHDGMWVYEIGGEKYVLLNSRMYFPKNYLTKTNNNFKEYDFELNTKPTTKFEVSSGMLTNMVTSENDTIVPESERQIYIMLEVRKLYEIDIVVVDSDYPDANGDRSVTVRSGSNSYLTIGGKTTGKLYTYNQAENLITYTFNEKYYSDVEFYLDNYVAGSVNLEMESLRFKTENKKHTIYVKYVPKATSANVTYKIDDEIKTEQYMIDNNIISTPKLWVVKDDSVSVGNVNTIYVNYFVNYSSVVLENKYYVNVTINGNDAGSEFNNGILNHKVVSSDFEANSIAIEILFTTIPTEIIQVKYVLANADLNIAGEPYYGEITVYEDGVAQLNENPSFDTDHLVVVSLLAGTKVELALNMNEGYEIYGVKRNNYSVNTDVELTTNSTYVPGETLNILTISTSYDFDADSGTYHVYLNKIDVTAKLTIEQNKSKVYSLRNNRLKSDTANNEDSSVKTIEKLFVNDIVTLLAEETDKETLKYFYYKKADNSVVDLYKTYAITSNTISINSTTYYVYNNMLFEDELTTTEVDFFYMVDGANVIVPDMEFTITSNLLKEVKKNNEYIINLGVEVINKYKLTYTLTGENYVDNFNAYVNYNEVKASDENYVAINCYSESYHISGTEISLFLNPLAGDYDVFVNGVDLGKNLSNEIYTIGTEDLVLNIVVKPAVYNVTLNESIYTNISDLDNATPTTTDKDNWINGYSDNQKAEFGTTKALQFNFIVKNNLNRNSAQLYEITIEGGCSKAYYIKDNKLYIDEAYTTEVDFLYSIDVVNNKVIVDSEDYLIVNNSISIPTNVNVKIENNKVLYLVNGVWVENNPTNYNIQLNLRTNKVLLSYDPTLDVTIKLNYLDYKSINSGI